MGERHVEGELERPVGLGATRRRQAALHGAEKAEGDVGGRGAAGMKAAPALVKGRVGR
jgi:hypothetical protein